MTNPRASIPATTSKDPAPCSAMIASTAAANAGPSANSGIRSLNRIPGFGKSGTSRTLLATRSAICTGPPPPTATGAANAAPVDSYQIVLATAAAPAGTPARAGPLALPGTGRRPGAGPGRGAGELGALRRL